MIVNPNVTRICVGLLGIIIHQKCILSNFPCSVHKPQGHKSELIVKYLLHLICNNIALGYKTKHVCVDHS